MSHPEASLLLDPVASPSVELPAASVASQSSIDGRDALQPWHYERRRRPRNFTLFPEQAELRPAGNRHVGYLAAKRTLDILGSLTLLVVLAPLLATVWLVLWVTTRGRPLFAQERVGFCGRRFQMYKFRTMYLDAEQRQHQVRNEKDGPIFKNRRDPRVTPLGRILRSLSIDELPQLINVLKGDMSLVGPRPPVPKEVAQYEPWQRRRLTIQPGLTCLWQVSGRSEIGFQDWVRMDLWYIEHQNLATDLWLLLKTPLSVLSRRGAY